MAISVEHGRGQSDFVRELRYEIGKLERRSPFDIALRILVLVVFAGLIVSLLRTDAPLVKLEAPASVLFGVVSLILLLAWFAQERATRAHTFQLQSLTELLHREATAEDAMKDPLTGLYHRGALEEIAQHFFSRAQRKSLR